MTLAFIGIGSNLQNPQRQVKIATLRLTQLPASAFCQASSYYQSPPLGPANQPDYINRVVSIETDLSPQDLLNYLQQIEREQGRVDRQRWGPRVIDLDILLYGNRIITTQQLTIPHVGLKDRAFVLYPLAEIAPDLVLPDGESVLSLKEQCLTTINRLTGAGDE